MIIKERFSEGWYDDDETNDPSSLYRKLLCLIKLYRWRDDEMRKNGRMIFLHLLWMSIAIMMGVYSCNSGIDDMGVFIVQLIPFIKEIKNG